MAKNEGCWIKPPKKPEKACGCVYSIVGYALYLCPKHAPKEEDDGRAE